MRKDKVIYAEMSETYRYISTNIGNNIKTHDGIFISHFKIPNKEDKIIPVNGLILCLII